jgi:cobalt-zinc-cadmium efflux system membrane fusion protein
MNWIKQHVALVALLVVVVAGATLFLTGTIRLNTDRGQTAKKAEKGEEKGETATENPSRAQGDRVILDEDAFKTSGIRTSPVTKGSIADFFEAPGEVQLAEDHIAHVTPQIPGVIRAVYKGVGDQVAKGSPLCLIESVELGDARASYVAGFSEMQLAERNYTRWKELYDKGLRTQNELITAEGEFTRAKLKMQAAASRLRGLGISADEIQTLEKEGSGAVSNQYTLRSPIAGSLLQRMATTGQGVTPADQVFFVASLSEVWVQAVAHEEDLPRIKTGARAVVRVPNLSEVALSGRVTYIGEQVDEKTRTVPLRILVKNSRATGRAQQDFLLRPGLFTNIQIETGHRNQVLVIPLSAIQTEASETYVFVRSGSPSPASNNDKPHPSVTFERRAVELGARAGRVVEVMKGLQLDEQIVVDNAYLLKSEMEKSKLED